jgi:hydroxymethylpyrimidine pyrophosphatase-like HAD family hydrolase
MHSAANRLNYDILAVDLDGTLLGPDGKVSAGNAAAVREARARGLEVVITTGRGLVESGYAIGAIDANVPAKGRDVAPIVCAGGAMLCDAKSGRTIHRWAMQKPLVRRLCDHFAAAGRAPLLLKDRDAAGFDYLVINSGPIEYPTQWWFNAMPVLVKFIDHVDHDEHPEHTVRVGFAAEAGVMLELARSVKEAFGKETTTQHFAAVAGTKDAKPAVAAAPGGTGFQPVMTQASISQSARLSTQPISDPRAQATQGEAGIKHDHIHLLEVFDPQVNKWTAVHRLALEQGVPRERVACIGDEVNDLAMIEGAAACGGLGIAMGNAIDSVKKAANAQTESFREDGLARAIERILRGEW